MTAKEYGKELVAKYGDYGQCHKVCSAIAEKFPEYKLTRGWIYDAVWGEREHWWLVKDGEIYDPTRSQFPCPSDKYVEFDPETMKEPTGICPNCGEYCYDGSTMCSRNCEIEFMASL